VTVTNAPPIVSARLGKARSWTLETYLAAAGYQGLRAALAISPEDVHDQANRANILSRGGAGFEAGPGRDRRPRRALRASDPHLPDTDSLPVNPSTSRYTD
jgi:NADH:ubiquinone oxidoreductase subunit F (NADH-binding)